MNYPNIAGFMLKNTNWFRLARLASSMGELQATIVLDTDEIIAMTKTDDTDDDGDTSSSGSSSDNDEDDGKDALPLGHIQSPPIGSAAEAASTTDSPRLPPQLNPDDDIRKTMPFTSVASGATTSTVLTPSMLSSTPPLAYTIVDDSDQVTPTPTVATSTSSSSSSGSGSTAKGENKRNIHILKLSTPLSPSSAGYGQWRIADLNYVVNSSDVDTTFDILKTTAPIVTELASRLLNSARQK
jgi:hypothetical protein